MPFKVYTRFDEEDEWTAVIDMKRSRSRLVERIFLNRSEAEYFVKNQLTKEDQSKIVEINVQ